MANWNSNCVETSAPISEVENYLVYDEKEKNINYNVDILYADVFHLTVDALCM